MSGFEVWFLFTFIPAINYISIWLALFFIGYGIITSVFAINSMMDSGGKSNEERKTIYSIYGKKTLKNFVIALCIICSSYLVPNQKTMSAIIVVPMITQNEKLLNAGGKAMDAAINLFNQWVDDITKQEKKEVPTPTKKEKEE